MRARSWFVGVIIGSLTGLVVSVAITVADWRINPAGLFHSEEGTNWAIVAETAFSWFWPVAAITLVVAVIIHSWISRQS